MVRLILALQSVPRYVIPLGYDIIIKGRRQEGSSSGTVRATLLVAAAPAEPCAGPCVGGKDRRARYSPSMYSFMGALITILPDAAIKESAMSVVINKGKSLKRNRQKPASLRTRL